MFKLGVRRLEQFQTGQNDDNFFQRMRRMISGNRISYQLLRTSIPPRPEEVDLFDEVMKQMQLSSGIFRTTVRRRFANLDPEINELLRRHWDAKAELEAEDWAASSCLTSAEWAESLFLALPAVTLRASDLTLFLIEAEQSNGDAFVFEESGALLQYNHGPFVVRMVPPEPVMVAWNYWQGRRAASHFARLWKQWRIPVDWLDQDLLRPARSEFRQGGTVFRRIPVVHPEAVTLALSQSRFRIARHSAFEALASPVDIIRTMNIFNNAYFAPQRLAEGAHAVWRSLKPGGIWIVGRTIQEAAGGNPPVHQVSVFTRTGTGFSTLWRRGPGSEIEALVLSQVW
jgi:hypothetical protein